MIESVTSYNIREWISYNPETGEFVWIKTPKNLPYLLGKPAGSVSKGRHRVHVDGKAKGSAHVAWFFMTGIWPDFILDHKDGNPKNVKWANIRRTDHSGNAQNRGGVKGYTYIKSKRKWMAKITHHGVNEYLGLFNTEDEARIAYLMRKQEVHDFQPVPREIMQRVAE